MAEIPLTNFLQVCFSVNKWTCNVFPQKKIYNITECTIKGNNQTVRELRTIAKAQGPRGYYQLRKADFIAYQNNRFKEQTTQGIPTPLAKTKRYKREPVHPGKIISHSQEVNKLKEQEMGKSRPVDKKQAKWVVWLDSKFCTKTNQKSSY